MALTAEVDANITTDMGSKAMRGVRQYLRDGAERGHAEAVDRAPVDRGTLQRAVAEFMPTWDGDTLKWGVRDIPYAKPMEFGTGPYYPPVQPLLDWGQRVAGDEGLGWYVARVKIPEEGITAQPYIRPGRDAQTKWYRSHSAREYIRREL